MNLKSVRKEIQELRNFLLYKYEPVCKAFILGAENSSSEADIRAYREAHPYTRVVVLTRKDCGEKNLD